MTTKTKPRPLNYGWARGCVKRRGTDKYDLVTHVFARTEQRQHVGIGRWTRPGTELGDDSGIFVEVGLDRRVVATEADAAAFFATHGLHPITVEELLQDGLVMFDRQIAFYEQWGQDFRDGKHNLDWHTWLAQRLDAPQIDRDTLLTICRLERAGWRHLVPTRMSQDPRWVTAVCGTVPSRVSGGFVPSRATFPTCRVCQGRVEAVARQAADPRVH